MTIEFTAASIGTNAGPFSIYSDLDGYLVPFETGITRQQLLDGFISSNVPDNTAVVRIISETICGNTIEANIPEATTTTTTIPPTTTSTTTEFPTVSCDSASSFSGGLSYPSSNIVTLGSILGEVVLNFNAFNIPDRYIVYWNGNVVIDTGYRGTLNYDFGGSGRTGFRNSLVGKIDPITGNVYPDLITYLEDGYPRVTSPGAGSESFYKNLSSPESATIEVYGPMGATGWNYTMFCPVSTTTTTTTVG